MENKEKKLNHMRILKYQEPIQNSSINERVSSLASTFSYGSDLEVISVPKKELAMSHKVTFVHITQLAFQTTQCGIFLFINLRINQCKVWIV